VEIPVPSQGDSAVGEMAEPLTGTTAEAPVEHDVQEQGLPKPKTLDSLTRANHYLICDKFRVIATWQNDGQGWMLKTQSGPQSAKRNAEQIPAHGDFMLVELALTQAEDGRRLTEVEVYELPKRWALPALARGDEAILRKIVGPGHLTTDQKLAVRKQIESQFMPDIWSESRAVLDYLSNADVHSSGAREDE
jgi:hypothetical protein